MSGWMKAINPLTTPSNEAEAVRGARASAISIGIGVLSGVWGVIYMNTFGKEVVQNAMDQAAAGAGSPEAAAMMGSMTAIVAGTAIAIVVIQAILGLVQWFKPNIVIPIIFTLLVLYGVGTGLLNLLMGQQLAEQMNIARPEVPVWQPILNWVILVIQLALHVAGIRGASALEKFRRASRV